MSARLRRAADDHQRGVVRQQAAARPAVEHRESAADHVRILEKAIVAPELAQRSDRLFASLDRALGRGVELDGAIAAEYERLNLIGRHRPMNREGQVLAGPAVQRAGKQGVTEIGRLVVRKRTQLGSLAVDDHEAITKAE